MVESAKDEISAGNDPSVAKQWDTKTPKGEQIDDFYAACDKLKVGLLTTLRKDVGPVSRAMATSRRTGPDFYYLSNTNSQKFKDLDNSKNVQITFHNSSNQDWISITGTATKVSNSDKLVHELYSPAISAWFGDAGDGVHNGTADDPRMAVIEVKPEYIAYWKSTSTTLGFVKEVAMSAITGSVAQTGLQRQFTKSDIELMRSNAASK